jgi:8-oxo-dGTP pyrophosphatase MutT (NUDIX family)
MTGVTESKWNAEEASPPEWRTTPSAGALVLRRGPTAADDRLLMVRQARVSGTRWEIPGGNQEPGETLEETAVREIDEECGSPVTAGGLLCTYLLVRGSVSRTGIGAYFLAEPVNALAQPVTRVPEEIIDVDYLDPLLIPYEELGPITRVVVERWWPRRREPLGLPFHVAVARTETGYELI